MFLQTTVVPCDLLVAKTYISLPLVVTLGSWLGFTLPTMIPFLPLVVICVMIVAMHGTAALPSLAGSRSPLLQLPGAESQLNDTEPGSATATQLTTEA